MSKKKKSLSVRYRQPFFRVTGGLFLIVTIITALLPVPALKAASEDFRVEGTTLVRYTGKDTQVVTPSGITAIGPEAFSDNTTLANVTIAEGVVFLSRGAFSGCSALESVAIPSTMATIQEKAFDNCQKLSKIFLPKNIFGVNSSAFSGCPLIQGTVIRTTEPESTQDADDTVSANAAGTTEESTNANTGTGSKAGKNANAGTSAGNTGSNAGTGTSANNSDKSTGTGAGTGTNTDSDESADIRGDMEETSSMDSDSNNAVIRDKSASNQEEASDTEEPDTKDEEPDTADDTFPAEEPDGMEVQENTDVIGKTKIIGGQALVLLDSKQAPVFSDGVSTAQTVKNEADVSPDGTHIVKASYYRSIQLKSYHFPEGITEIEDFAFARSGLMGMKIPDSVETIGYAAFYHCDSLASVTIPNTVTLIQGEAFDKTPWLTRWEESDGAEDFLIVGDGILLRYKGNSPEVTVPEGVKQIASDAFRNHTEIQTVTFPESLTAIRNNAFDNCSGLRGFEGGNQLTNIEPDAFSNCPLTVMEGSAGQTENLSSAGQLGTYHILHKKEQKNPGYAFLKMLGIISFGVFGAGSLAAGFMKSKS